MSDKLEERQLLLTHLKYTDLIGKLGQEIKEPYSLQFNESGYDGQYNRMNLDLAIKQIADRVTDEELVSFFSRYGAKGYEFYGQYYTLAEGQFRLWTRWPEFRERLIKLSAKHGESLAAVLQACYRVCIEKGRQRNNYLQIEATARELGAAGFRTILTDLELAELLVRHKGDIELRKEMAPLVRQLLAASPSAEPPPSPESAPEAAVKSEGNPLGLTIPEDLFDTIEGFEDIKRLTQRALASSKPVHLLYTGVPGSAKTLFLLELARLGAAYILGSQATKSGMADLLFNLQPAILLVDEIDHIGNKDTSILLSLMQTGIESEAKHGHTRQIVLPTRVFAASNTTKMPPALLSRFMTLYFRPYAQEDFLMVTTNVLQKREGLEPELAAYIAGKVWALPARFADPRQAISIARLAKTKEEADEIIEVIRKRGNEY